MRHPTIRRSIFVAVVLSVMSPLSAIAQSAGESERAEKLFSEASALIAAGKYVEACPKFQESQQLDPGLGTQFNLALCYEKVGKLGSAWRNFRAVERLAHAAGKKGREDSARERMAELRPRVAHLALSANDADATLKVDGEQVDHDDWAFYAVDPGAHTVLATAPAKKPWQTSVNFAATATEGPAPEVSVAVPQLEVAQGQTRVVTVTKETSNTKRTLGYVAGGLGIVGVGAAVVTGIVILNSKSTASTGCTLPSPNPDQKSCDQSGRDAARLGRTLIPVNIIAWAVGAAGLGVGSYLLLTSGKKSAAASAQVAPFFGRDGGGLSVLGRF